MPRVSILMPCYNAGRYLDAAMASMLAQTYTDFEVLALDDGSTDGSWERLQVWAGRDSRVRATRLAHVRREALVGKVEDVEAKDAA